MNYSLDIRPLAILEARDAFDWYEGEQDGLGYIFLQELEDLLEKIRQNPSTFSYIDAPVRQAQMRRFPYTITYEIVEDRVGIFTAFMTAQDPDKKRLL